MNKVLPFLLASLVLGCGSESSSLDPKEEPTFTCPQREVPNQCSVGHLENIEIADLHGYLLSPTFIQNPDGLYLKFEYEFRDDGTYLLLTTGLQPVTSDCQVYSDGEGSYQESGVYSLSNGTILLQPAVSEGSPWMVSFEPHELSIHHYDPVNRRISLSSKDFCNLEFDVTK